MIEEEVDKHYVAVLANLKQDHENIKQQLKRKKQEQLDAHEKKNEISTQC